MIYADVDYYTSVFCGTKDVTEAELKAASKHIDTLTYNRAVDFEKLTPFQQLVIRESVCMLADFEHDNADLIESVIASYSLNGASVTFGGANADVVNGVCIRKDIYGYLSQSGLCCGVLK